MRKNPTLAGVLLVLFACVWVDGSDSDTRLLAFVEHAMLNARHDPTLYTFTVGERLQLPSGLIYSSACDVEARPSSESSFEYRLRIRVAWNEKDGSATEPEWILDPEAVTVWQAYVLEASSDVALSKVFELMSKLERAECERDGKETCEGWRKAANRLMTAKLGWSEITLRVYEDGEEVVVWATVPNIDDRSRPFPYNGTKIRIEKSLSQKLFLKGMKMEYEAMRVVS